VELERSNGGHNHGGLRLELADPALDVEELLGDEVRSESRLGDDDFGYTQGRFG
jgi:hypothetical protein